MDHKSWREIERACRALTVRDADSIRRVDDFNARITNGHKPWVSLGGELVGDRLRHFRVDQESGSVDVTRMGDPFASWQSLGLREANVSLEILTDASLGLKPWDEMSGGVVFFKVGVGDLLLHKIPLVFTDLDSAADFDGEGWRVVYLAARPAGDPQPSSPMPPKTIKVPDVFASALEKRFLHGAPRKQERKSKLMVVKTRRKIDVEHGD
jgi:hypothetical protein